ncbi:hypothetical protein BDQ17DRAFT_1261032, partial [Cyathus striatus]
VIVFGDLLTGQHVRSILESRSEESTSWFRMQFIIFVIGLFHFKMACTDAIWKIFIYPLSSNKNDQNSLMTYIEQIHPRETVKIESKPGFHQMHEVIQHVGIASRIDAWRTEVTKMYPVVKNLEDFALMNPTWEDLQSIAKKLCINYVASGNPTEPTSLSGLPNDEDQQLQNMRVMQQYFLLYEETTYALNHGDIGHVETCFMPWMFIFLGCGKVKYAAELRQYLENVHFHYSKGLRFAKHNNLYIKVCKTIIAYVSLTLNSLSKLTWQYYCIYGGKFSNHQKQQILSESPLIEVYKNTQFQFEKMFCLEHKTNRHSPPDMMMTFSKLAKYMKDNKANTEVKG